MLHKSTHSFSVSSSPSSSFADQTRRPHLVASSGDARDSRRRDLVSIASRRCSSFFAEAAVLVLVFGILDFFLQRGRMDGLWVAGALAISVSLLAASVATDFTARRWLGAQP
jgi:hypothetical protein